jgi:hypothetical protein
MGTSWTKEQIQALKKSVYAHREDPSLEEQLFGLNIHLSNHARATLFHTKNDEWKVVERIASEINEKLRSLQNS